MSPRNNPAPQATLTPLVAPSISPERGRLRAVLASIGLATAPLACGRVDGTAPENSLIMSYDDPCECMDGTEVSLRGKNASQETEPQTGVIENGLLVIERADLLIDQPVEIKHGPNRCGDVELTDPNSGAHIPLDFHLKKGENTYEWEVESNKGECAADDTTTGDSEGNDSGDIPCTEHSDCYQNGEGLCNKSGSVQEVGEKAVGECFEPTLCYASSKVKGATDAIQESPSDELVIGADFEVKGYGNPNGQDGMNFGVNGYAGYLINKGEHCVELPDGLGVNNVVEVRKEMLDPNNPDEALVFQSPANKSFLQSVDASRFTAMTYDQVFNADESLKIHGQIAITNPLLSAIPGLVDTFAFNDNVEQED